MIVHVTAFEMKNDVNGLVPWDDFGIDIKDDDLVYQLVRVRNHRGSTMVVRFGHCKSVVTDFIGAGQRTLVMKISLRKST